MRNLELKEELRKEKELRARTGRKQEHRTKAEA